jgi:predicted MPP superfamily phosphohydrolase
VARWLIIALALLATLAIFAPFTWVTVRHLLRFHPRRRRIILAAALLGNLMWPFFPLLRTFTPATRAIRSILGPPWFAWACLAILYTSLILILLLAWLPFRQRIEFPRFGRWPSRVFLSLTLIGSVVGYYQALVPLRVERVPMFVENLPPDAEGTRIVLLADLHVGLFTRPARLRAIFERTRELRPDFVLIAGDMIDDDPFFIGKLLEGTGHLGPDTPIFAALGNHEIYGDPFQVIERLRGSRIRLLVNDGATWKSLRIGAIGDYAAAREARSRSLAPDLERAIAGPGFPILFAHQPRVFDEARAKKLPVTLVAHTHGGQCGFRPLGWSLAGLFLPYHMGLYRRESSQLYVNTGTGYWLLPFRLGMTPEITLIELRAMSGAARQSTPR